MTARRIIVVEDERIVAIQLEEQLKHLGYKVVAVVSSGEQALARTVELLPDLVLMDIHIRGELDGIETSARIPDALGIPVVYVTGDSDEATLERARATGPYGFLVKPVSGKDLHVTIQTALERHRLHEAVKKSRRDLAESNRQLRLKIAEGALAERELRMTNRQLTDALDERAAAEGALARSAAEFRAGFEGSVVGKALVEPRSSRYLRVNRAFAQMLGYEPHEIVGRTGAEFTWPEDRESGLARQPRLVAGEVRADVDVKRYMRRDGTPFWVRVSAALAHVAGRGDPALAVATIEDIDASRKAEAALLTAKHDLERLVEERTHALADRELLLRQVHHRVKNNLQIVDGLLVMQARKTDDLRAREGLLGLRGRVYALGLVHRRLLESQDLRTFDVGPFLHELSKNVLESGGTDSVRLSVEACALTVGLDFALPFGLLATELLTNSLMRGCSDGTGHVAVALRTDETGKLILTVSGDGPGGRAGAAAAPPGVGVGGVVVRALVGELEGEMIVEDHDGLRTEIRMAMPAPT
jgi:PAS domain S-box-containing protein